MSQEKIRTPSLATALPAVFGFLVLGLSLWLGNPGMEDAPVEHSDVTTYRAIVGRLRNGEPYHATIGAELRQRGYATREIFNWRTPLHFTALSRVSERTSRILLALLSSAVAMALLAVLPRQRPAVVLVGVIALAGVAIFAAGPPLQFLPEAWAGALVGASVAAFAHGRVGAAVAFGLLALFTREIAAPYCVACTVAAAHVRQWRQVAAWLSGAAGYALYYGWHVAQVLPLRLPTDLGHSGSWIEFGGLPFLLTTVQWMGWLFIWPWPGAAIALGCIVAATLSDTTPRPVRIASAAYLIWFIGVGKTFDHYWGLMVAPVWAVATAFGADVMLRAVKNAGKARTTQ